MPTSLMDMFQPSGGYYDVGGKQQPQMGFGDLLAQRSNSLIGLGLGLMSGTREDPYGNALRGHAQGSNADQNRYESAQNLAERKAARAQAQANADRAFTQSQVTDAQRAMKDVLGPNAAPEQKADFMKNYYSSRTDPGGWILKDIIDPNDPDSERKITVQEHNRTGQIRPPQLPGQTGTTGAAADPFTVGRGQSVYGVGGNFGATPQGAPASSASAPRHAITLPSGEVVTPPPGLNKEARKAWATDVAKTVADMQTGKMTEGQAKYSIYATGMEIAQQELQNSSQFGTSAEGKGLGGLPWGVGAYFQSNAYQNYRNAKDAWLNAKLRAESGATINPDEFARDDRIYFPQPGEGPEQVAAKAKLREQITKNMTKAGGPGYTSPPPLAPAPAGTPAAPGAAPTQGSPTAAPVRVTSPAAARKLPSGTQIILPDGRLGTVP